jgi:hypothetical protein
MAVAALLAALCALAAGVALVVVRRRRSLAAIIGKPSDRTVTDPQTGAVRSTQAADLELPTAALDEIWSPMHLERLARTYWRFLTRSTLGLIRVKYSEGERFLCLGFRPIVLIAFRAPEYAMDAQRGIVRWRIERGILVARQGRGRGYLQIDIRRQSSAEPGHSQLHVEVEVANFYPAIAFRIGRWVYANTQSRIHVIVTHAFLRSLARLDLAESVVGRFADLDEVPDPSTESVEPAL